jgi:hypothetical protein
MFSKLRIYMQFVQWNVYQLSTSAKKIYLNDSSIQRLMISTKNWLFYWKAFDIILLLKDMDILK